MDSKVLIAIAAAVIVVGAGCGVYLMMGGEDAKETLLSITEPGEYENGTYDKVIISAAVGNEDVLLKNIKILKSLIIRGGGSHSVTLDGCTNQGTTTVEKEGGEDVRINLVNTTLSNVQVTSNVILEADADSGFSNVNLDGANATVQGNDTKVESVAMGNDTALTVNEGTVVAVDVPAQTNATVQTAADGNIQNANVAGNLTVDGADTTIGNVNMQNDSALSVQNGSVENVNIPSSSTVSMDVSASGEVQTATVGTGVSINTGDQTDLSGMTIQASEGTEGAVTVNVNDVPTHAHNFVISSVDWEHMDPQTLEVAVTYECDCHDTKQETVTAKMTVLTEPTCTEKGTGEYSLPDMPNAVHIVEIDALGHEYYAEFTWTQNNDGSYSAVCSVYCRHEPNSNPHNVDAVVTPATAPASSCTEDVVTTYTAAATYDGSDFTDTKTVTVPKAHKYEVTSVDIMSGEGTSEQDYTIMATLTCTVCSEGTEGHQITERLRVVSSEFVEPSCGQGTPGHRDLVLLYNGEELTYHQDLPAEHMWFFDSINADDREHPTMTLICLHCHTKAENIEATLVITDRVEPTCTQAGSYKYHAECTYEGNQYQSFEETVLLKPLGHEYHYEFDWADDHSSAKLIVTCEREGCQFHEEVRAQIDVQTNATCTVAGDTVYTATATFLNEERQATKSVNGEPLGHDYHIIDINWQTLDKDTMKVTVTYECSRCQEGDVGHTVTGEADVSVRVTDPTCTLEGNRYYYVEGSNFNGIGETIPALGHILDYTFQWSDDLLSAILHEECTREGCDYEHDYQANVVPNTVDPTCTQPGQTVYTATYTTEDGVVHSDTRTVTIPAVGHRYVVSEIRWDTTLDRENMTVEVVYECTLCDDETPGHTKTETVAVRSETTPSTCAVHGHIHYYVPDSGDNGYSDELPLGEHTLTHYEGQEATCTEAGWNAYDICSVCGYSTLEVIPALGHDLQHHDAKAPTTDEVGWEAYDTCSRCDYTTYVEISKIHGYTVIVYGGLVAEKGDEPTASQITVPENTVVTVTYTGEDLSYWMDDYGDLIPGETFDILVTCDLYVTAHDVNDRVYGEWQTVREPTCTENGLYYRESGEFRQYRTVMATGHESDFNFVVDTPATCTSEGSGHSVCVKCQEHIPYTIPVAEHSYEYTTLVTANGSVVGKQIGECTECGHKTIREYITPIYPSGNIVVTLDWDNARHDVNLSLRDEVHTMWKFTDAQGIERQAYLYQIQLDQFKNGYITGMDVTTWIFWADYGEHSPVYIARHNQTVPVYGGANNSASWAVAGYVDDLQEFIYLIDKLSVEVTIDGEEHHISLGMDNGRNASALYDLYNMWADRFNAGMKDNYQVDHQTYLGQECTVYYNDDEAFYVNSDNCCLRWSTSNIDYYGIERGDIVRIVTVTDAVTLPFTNGYCDSNGLPQFSTYYFNNMPTLENSTYFCVKLINGSYNSGDFTMGNVRYNFFNADSRNLVMWIEPTLSDHYELSDILVLNKLGEWMSVPYVKVDGHYEFNIQDRSINGLYRYMMDLYPDKFVLPNDPTFNGVFIKCVTSKVVYDTTVTVTGGTFTNDLGEDITTGGVYGGSYISLNFEEVTGKTVSSIRVTVNGGDPQVTDFYGTYMVPQGSVVTIEPILEAVVPELAHVDVSCTAGGAIDRESGDYDVNQPFICIATPEMGYVFDGWYDLTEGGEPNEQNCWTNGTELYLWLSEGDNVVYKAVFKPIDTESLNEYTKVLATKGFVHWDGVGVYLSALYGNPAFGDRMYVHADPNRDAVYRWDITGYAEDPNSQVSHAYPAEDWFDGNVKFCGEITTVVAVFSADLSFYDLTYDLNGAEGSVEGGTYANDEEVYLSGAPEREGYDFNGWNTQADGNGTPYEAQQRIFLDGNLVLYAQWSPKTSTVTVSMPYAINYQFYNITQQKINVTYGQPALIPAGIVTDLKGFTITGWSYNYNAEVVTVAADGTGTVPYGVTSIVAVCSYITYTIHFDKNSEAATGEMEDRTFQVKDMINGQNINVSKPYGFTRSGYKIDGWKCGGSDVVASDSDRNVSLNMQALVLSNPDSAATFELKAQWSSITYRIFYKTTNQNTSFGTTSAYFNGSDAQWYIMDQNGVFNGANTYYLIGWTANQDGSGTVFANPVDSAALIALSDSQYRITIYAKWAVKAYTVEFYDDPESQTPVATQNLQYGAGSTALTSVDSMVKEGCIFVGWDTDPSANNVVYHDGATVSNLVTDGSAFKLYAVWIHSSYTVHFDKNAQDATGEMGDQTFNANEAKGLTLNAFAREGYEFDRWCTTEYNQGEFFDNGETVKNLTTEESITLYAIWKQAPGS